MQRNGLRHFTAYVITILMYILIVGYIYYSQEYHFVSSKETKEKVIQMSLSTFMPEMIEEVKENIVEAPVIEPEVKEESKIEEMIPEPIIEKIMEKPVIKKIVIEKPKVEKKKLVEKPKKQRITKKTVKKKKKKIKEKASKKQASSKHSKSTPAQRNMFWSALRIKIDRHKFYPRIAKKRRMEGSIKVRFTILVNGNIGHISVSGPKVFYNSARNAVKKAFPINAKKSPISLPTSINLTLRYQLR